MHERDRQTDRQRATAKTARIRRAVKSRRRRSSVYSGEFISLLSRLSRSLSGLRRVYIQGRRAGVQGGKIGLQVRAVASGSIRPEPVSTRTFASLNEFSVARDTRVAVCGLVYRRQLGQPGMEMLLDGPVSAAKQPDTYTGPRQARFVNTTSPVGLSLPCIHSWLI